MGLGGLMDPGGELVCPAGLAGLLRPGRSAGICW